MSSLIRQDTGDQLVIDAPISSREVLSTRVSQHPVETQRTITDHAQRQAIGRQLEILISETPTVRGLTTGPERVAEVYAWLEAVRGGVPLTLVEEGLPIRRDMRLTEFTPVKEAAGGLRASLTLLQGVTATTRTVELQTRPAGGGGGRTTPRADLAAGRAPTEDRGQRSGRQSALSAALDLVWGE